MNDINTCGTSYRGHFYLPYARVIELLGQPNAQSDGHKTDLEWSFEKDGVVATVYNWKNGPNYTGKGSVEDINIWNIGGFGVRSVYLVSDMLEGNGQIHYIPSDEIADGYYK